jgi:hypothetical protein
MQLEDKTRNIIERECEDYFLGVEDLSLTNDPVILQYKTLLNEYPRAISIGITLPFFKDKSAEENIYKLTDLQLKNITTHICNILEDEGYSTFSVPKSYQHNTEASISLHMLAAKHAKIGKIKRNGIFTTPEMDLEINLGTVLTDAPLKNL